MKGNNNKVQIFFKKSFKNRDRNKIEHDRPGPTQDFSWAGPLRPKIFADRAGPLRPEIYKPVIACSLLIDNFCPPIKRIVGFVNDFEETFRK